MERRGLVSKAVAHHSELRASVDPKVRAVVKEALAQAADALECACCFERLAPALLWRSSGGGGGRGGFIDKQRMNVGR